jgi:hypothetical protein
MAKPLVTKADTIVRLLDLGESSASIAVAVGCRPSYIRAVKKRRGLANEARYVRRFQLEKQIRDLRAKTASYKQKKAKRLSKGKPTAQLDRLLAAAKLRAERLVARREALGFPRPYCRVRRVAVDSPGKSC